MNFPDSNRVASANDAHPAKVGILLFDGVEVLDFAGPFEVFSVTGRLTGAFDVSTVARTTDLVIARHGLMVQPMYAIDEAPSFDLLIVPGGIMTTLLEDELSLAFISNHHNTGHLVASVCTGAFALARIGLLANRRATTHWEDIQDLGRSYPDIEVVHDVPYVDEGDIVTSAGISAGIDMSLFLVARLMGKEIATATARQMQYEKGWDKENGI